MEVINKFRRFRKRQIQLDCELVLAHAVHQPQADCLSGLTVDLCHVRDHLVEVGVGVLAIGVGHGLCTRQL